eukprot:2149557-Rhodomonas_salina.1
MFPLFLHIPSHHHLPGKPAQSQRVAASGRGSLPCQPQPGGETPKHESRRLRELPSALRSSLEPRLCIEAARRTEHRQNSDGPCASTLKLSFGQLANLADLTGPQLAHTAEELEETVERNGAGAKAWWWGANACSPAKQSTVSAQTRIASAVHTRVIVSTELRSVSGTQSRMGWVFSVLLPDERSGECVFPPTPLHPEHG